MVLKKFQNQLRICSRKVWIFPFFLILFYIIVWLCPIWLKIPSYLKIGHPLWTFPYLLEGRFLLQISEHQKKRGIKEGRSWLRSPHKYEGHSHIAPFDKKEWHSYFALSLGSGTHERRSKECRSCTLWVKVVKMCKILTFKVNFLSQEASESF